jgi:hypothetical protein
VGGDKFAQNGWDEVEWFGDDDQAAVIYKVTLRATNTVTGESFQTRNDLRWVSNGNGEVIHGQGSQTNHATPCRVKGNV